MAFSVSLISSVPPSAWRPPESLFSMLVGFKTLGRVAPGSLTWWLGKALVERSSSTAPTGSTPPPYRDVHVD